jgi:glycosyltransferase involved in cell wall biosynthesis
MNFLVGALMSADLSIIIAHYHPNASEVPVPLQRTLRTIAAQQAGLQIEVIIADDGSEYCHPLLATSRTVDVDQQRQFHIATGQPLQAWLQQQGLDSDLIQHWVHLPKRQACMAKARVLNQAVELASSEQLLFLDDDNYLATEQSLTRLCELFTDYDFVIGQVQDGSGRFRPYSSYRVQGTTIAIRKSHFTAMGGFGAWTERYSCGVDSDFWLRLYRWSQQKEHFRACFTNEIITVDSVSKRWKKFTGWSTKRQLRQAFKERYQCKNYKHPKHNPSRDKTRWVENLVV